MDIIKISVIPTYRIALTDGTTHTVAFVPAAQGAMGFTHYIVIDGVERWSDTARPSKQAAASAWHRYCNTLPGSAG